MVEKHSNYNKIVLKWLLTIVLAIVLLACLFAATACKKHRHEYVAEVTCKPTCTENGVKTFTCECGDSYTEPVPAIGHNYTVYAQGPNSHWSACLRCHQPDPNGVSAEHVYTIVNERASIPATCTQQGKEVKMCVCGATKETVLPMANHQLSYSFEGDQHWQECVNCDYVSSKVAHSYTTIVSQTLATCTDNGLQVNKCACGDTKETVLYSTGHSLQYNSNTEKHWQECANCSYVTAQVVHDYKSEVTKNATCMVKGETTYTCECKRSYTEPIDIIPHDYTKVEKTSANHWTACTMCGAVDPANPKTAHSWQITGVKQAATCEDNGYDFVKCSVCDYESTQMSNRLGHDYSKIVLGESNANGHRLQCVRCEKFVFNRHDSMDAKFIGADVACPDGHNKAPTCGANGHQDKTCLICGEAFHTVVPATGDHTPTEWVTTHGTEHWRTCEVCKQELERTRHTEEWRVTKEATCDATGRENLVCTICGHVGNGRSINAIGHNYKPTGVTIKEPDCYNPGSEETKCVNCGNISSKTVEKLGHDYTAYKADANGHFRTCNRCGREDRGNHNYGKGTVIQQAKTCGEVTITRYTCSFDQCGYNDDRETVMQHSYRQVESSYVEGDCSHYAEYDERCTNCGDVKHVVGTEYGAHDVVFFPKKDKTETEDGNRAYWQCTICGRYYSSKTCVTELYPEDIFDPAPRYIVLETIDQMLEIMLSLPSNTPSYDIYEITVEVLENMGYGRLWVWDDVSDVDDCYILFSPTTDLTNIGEGDIITIKGHLILDDAEGYFADAEIIAVVSESDLYNFNMSVNDEILGYVEAESETGEKFSCNTNSPQSLMLGESLTFTCYREKDDAVLKSVIINGKAYSTDSNGQITIKVAGDVKAEFVFDTTNRMSVSINNFNTSTFDAGLFAVNEYLSYEYIGNTNDYGRLYQNSSTKFFLNNASLVSVVIEYEDYKLDQVVNNTVYVGADVAHKNSYGSYAINSNTKKATLTFDFANALRYFEYFANVSQARIKAITFNYATNNTLAIR